MAQQSSATIGSGTLPFTPQILSSGQRGIADGGRGERYGTNVVVINPEDQVAVDAFAASGVNLTTTTVELLSPASNPLPRSRQVTIQNTDGTNDVLIGHFADFTDLEGFVVSATSEPATSKVTIPILHNVTLYARAAAGTATVKLLIL